MRGRLQAIFVAALLLALPASASAGSVSTSGSHMVISAGSGKNELLITAVGAQIRVAELNPDQGLRPRGSACMAVEGERAEVECPADGIGGIEVLTRGGNDWVVVGKRQPDSRGDRNDCRGSKIGAVVGVALGAGNDVTELGDGPDSINGGSGRDLLMGCGGGDQIAGGPDADDVSGDNGNDLLSGQGGNDRVIGCRFDPDDVNYPRDEGGEDILGGGAGEDFLFGCDGRDEYDAGGGDDALNTLDEVSETVGCGDGEDLIFRDPVDTSDCEVTTSCTTDNYPIGPDTGVPSCFVAGQRARQTRASV